MRAVADDGAVVELNEDGSWSRVSKPGSLAGDFRGVAWGASVVDVRSRENADPVFAGDGLLVFSERLADMDSEAVYIFDGGRLTRAKYIFREQFTSPNRYLGAYSRVQILFTAKYGDPESDRTIWHDELYRDDPDSWGNAVQRGDLTLLSSWTTRQTEIGLLLHGNDYEAHLEVEYVSIELKAWAESLRSQSELDLI
ncbi:hypothetical protein QL996_04630 [Planococcus sp. APC 4015]|nr:hypothetical protein [Planococcus sp. APC 4015]